MPLPLSKPLAALAALLLAAPALAVAPRLEDRLAQAHASAHQGRLEEAQAAFREVLAERPDELEAVTGLGYALAWSGRHDEARLQFLRAEALRPGHADAAKGLAYVALWRGDHGEAASRFRALAAQEPGSAEPLVGLGQSLAAGGQRREAHLAFARAATLEPARPDALLGLRDTAPPGPSVRATALAGLTSADGHSELGLRFAELAAEPAEGWLAWLQYDDSLSLDNLALARSGDRAPAGYLGGRRDWGGGLATRLEAGARALPGGVRQWLARGEQEVGLGPMATLKVGGWVGPRSDDRTEGALHGGAALSLGRHLRVEPVLFLAWSGLAGERQLRGLLGAEWAFDSGVTVGAGASAGRARSPIPGADGHPSGAYARLGVPIGRGWTGQALVTRERPVGAPDLTMLALGLSATVGGRP